MKRKEYIYILISVFALAAALFFIFKKNDEKPASKPKLKKEEKTTPVTAPPAPTTHAPTPEDSKNTFMFQLNHLEKQIAQCQNTLSTLIPDDIMDQGKLKIKDLDQLKDIIKGFYQAVDKKITASEGLMKTIEKVPENHIPGDLIFDSLSKLDDCGEFEEESLTELVITYATQENLTSEQKREIMGMLLPAYRAQLKLNLGLQHMFGKMVNLKLLLDADFISRNHADNINVMSQSIEEIEGNYRAMLPQDILQKQSLNQKEILEIKSIEKDEVDKVKLRIIEVLDDIERE